MATASWAELTRVLSGKRNAEVHVPDTTGRFLSPQHMRGLGHSACDGIGFRAGDYMRAYPHVPTHKESRGIKHIFIAGLWNPLKAIILGHKLTRGKVS